MEKFTHGCTLDCFDLCRFEVYKENGRVTNILGNKEDYFTDGFICNKGRKHLERLYHSDRLKKPLLKTEAGFVEITFEEAIEMIAEKLSFYKKEYSSLSTIHYAESGSDGFLKKMPDIFFNFYGGVTTSKGSTCWGAGTQAHKYDFGDRKTSLLEDLENAKSIIFWGRNPYNTSIHLYKRALEAKKRGAKIITIDPRRNETSKIADFHMEVSPSGDGALAMAITKVLLEKGWENREFINKYTLGFEEYEEYLSSLSLEYLLSEADVSDDEVRALAEIMYEGSCSIFIGYGMQKYTNGGNSVRAIDILAGISGNIGEKGAGAFFANRVAGDFLDRDPYDSEGCVEKIRQFWVADFIDFIEEGIGLEKDPVKAIFITKCNPLNQFPHLNETIEAFKKIEFKVCFDMFMTATAQECDLVIPVSNTLESEDILYSSMHNSSLIYNEKVVEPENILMDEFYFFRQLAEKMEMEAYPQIEKNIYLNRVLKPLDITTGDLKISSYRFEVPMTAWEDKKFLTSSGKFEIYSEEAERDGLSPYPTYIPAKRQEENYPYQLITPHHKNSLFSQHFIDVDGKSHLFVSKEIFDLYGEEKTVWAVSSKGKIECEIHLDETLKNNLVYMFVGWHHRHGNPNFLTHNGSSEMGGQITYNETFIDIIKKEEIPDPSK